MEEQESIDRLRKDLDYLKKQEEYEKVVVDSIHEDLCNSFADIIDIFKNHEYRFTDGNIYKVKDIISKKSVDENLLDIAIYNIVVLVNGITKKEVTVSFKEFIAFFKYVDKKFTKE